MKQNIEYQEIIDLLVREFTLTMRQDEKFYQGTQVVIEDEQQFVKRRDMTKGTIFLVVKFLPATINFGQVTLPFVITAFSERNGINKCQKLLLDFAQIYNLETNQDGTIRQYYTSPSMLNAFNDIADGYRSSMFVNGTLLISKESNPAKIFYDNDHEELPVITFGDSVDIQGDRQAFYNTNDFAKTLSTVGSYTISIVMYLTNDEELLNDVLRIKFGQLNLNKIFYFTISYKNGISSGKIPMKLVNASVQQNVGELPVISMTFTR